MQKNKDSINAYIPDPSEDPQEKGDQTNNNSVFKIKDLNKTSQNWTLKARVTKKQHVKSCKSGTGQMQKIDLIDQDSSEISMMLFDDAIIAVGEVMTEGEVYFIFNGKVKETMGKGKDECSKLTIFADKQTRVQHSIDDNEIPKAVYFY